MSTDAVPAPERFGWWAELMGRQVMPVSICPYRAAFRGRVEAVETPDTQVADFGFSPMTARRSAVQIRRHDPEFYYLVLVRGAPMTLTQGRRTACLEAGGMALFSTSHPLECDFVDIGRQSRLTLMRLSRATLPLPGGRADLLLGEPLPARTGPGRLLASYLAQLSEAGHDSTPADLARLGAVGVDLAATVLAARLDGHHVLPDTTRKATLLARVHAFIERHLHDPDLRPAAIAAHHHISVRSLHELFRDETESVAASIRRRRLARCHADLTDPTLRHRTIAETATRWALRPGDLGRVFRNVYGATPHEIREQARDADGPPAAC
ncbi:helix-turn-helix domain-containing protein [Embleya scabrispora]|uniref:AraC-like ligand-binding domain-containing protein n=1 Tax=Embleya scabrispora TaxID=159449 RepID=UPI001FE0BCAA|nr:helix-turn-helix domain-containing protein [Embleya scabrispora]